MEPVVTGPVLPLVVPWPLLVGWGLLLFVIWVVCMAVSFREGRKAEREEMDYDWDRDCDDAVSDDPADRPFV